MDTDQIFDILTSCSRTLLNTIIIGIVIGCTDWDCCGCGLLLLLSQMSDIFAISNFINLKKSRIKTRDHFHFVRAKYCIGEYIHELYCIVLETISRTRNHKNMLCCSMTPSGFHWIHTHTFECSPMKKRKHFLEKFISLAKYISFYRRTTTARWWKRDCRGWFSVRALWTWLSYEIGAMISLWNRILYILDGGGCSSSGGGWGKSVRFDMIIQGVEF